MIKRGFDANLIAATITNNDNQNVRNIFSHSTALQINKWFPQKQCVFVSVHLSIYAMLSLPERICHKWALVISRLRWALEVCPHEGLNVFILYHFVPFSFQFGEWLHCIFPRAHCWFVCLLECCSWLQKCRGELNSNSSIPFDLNEICKSTNAASKMCLYWYEHRGFFEFE